MRRAITTAALAVLVALALAAPGRGEAALARLPGGGGRALRRRCACRSTAPARCRAASTCASRASRLSDNARPPFLMYLSGGPGGAGVVEMIDVLLELPRLTRDFTVLGFDQRGTGAQRAAALPGARARRAACAPRGAGERVRAAARPASGRSTRRPTPSRTWRRSGRRPARPKLTLFGISYGTELALAYARALPGPGRAADPRLRRRPGRERPVRARRLPRDGPVAARALPATAAAASRPTRPPTSSR